MKRLVALIAVFLLALSIVFSCQTTKKSQPASGTDTLQSAAAGPSRDTTKPDTVDSIADSI